MAFALDTPALAAANAAACAVLAWVAFRRYTYRRQTAGSRPEAASADSGQRGWRRWPALVYGVAGLPFFLAYRVLSRIGEDDPAHGATIAALVCFGIALILLGVAAWKAFVATNEKSVQEYRDKV